MLLTALIFILILGLLVFVHELGHFAAARKSGVRVDEFGIGFPPKILGIKKGETEYSLNALPIGGFVKIFGEDSDLEELEKTKKKLGFEEIKRNFAMKSPETRAKITAAGVIMNFLLAFVLFSFGFMVGLPAATGDFFGGTKKESGNIFLGLVQDFDNMLNKTAKLSDVKIQIVAVMSDSPAEKSKIKIGDAIVYLKAKNAKKLEISENDDMVEKKIQEFIKEYLGQEIVIGIKRGKEIKAITAIPRTDPLKEEGALGIAFEKMAIVSYPFYVAPLKGLETSVILIFTFLEGYYQIVKNLIFEGKTAAGVIGPVGIASLTGQMARLGFVYVLQFAAILSLNLAIINILPFPALDGGRLVFIVAEKIKGSPVSMKWERIIHSIGLALLLLLMLIITFKDIARFF